jgi:RHS repeat-associated protein
MPTWRLELVEAGDVTWVDRNGQTQTRHFSAGGVFRSEDACEMLRFIEARGGSVTETQEGVLDRLQDACGGGGAAGQPAPSPTPTPPADSHDGNPGAEDGAVKQGAPTTTPSSKVDAKHDTPGNDPRPPADQMADPDRPVPPGEVRDGRMAQGDTQAQAEDAARRGEHNDPLPGQPHPTHSDDHGRTQTRTGDPVDLFVGLFTIVRMDLDAGGAILPLELIRSYRSGRPYFGPFGYGWDHNFNIYLRELSDGRVARWSGALAEDVFTTDGVSFFPPRGIHERLDRLGGPAVGYAMTKPGGLTHHFEQPAGWTDAERIPLVRIEDRHGNRQDLEYDTENRLARVIDAEGRFLRFGYGDCGFLEHIEDHTSRRVEYYHADDIEHLVAVRYPPIDGYPDGVFTQYEYAPAASHPAMRHNIVRVTDPDGRTYLQNWYEEDPASYGWNRVVRQALGDFMFEYAYQQIQFVPADPVFADIGQRQALVREPDGAIHTYTFNYRGDLLDHRYRLVRDHSYRVVARQWTYDEAGNQISETSPDGAQRISTFDHANIDPTARGNLLRVELTARAGFPAPSRLVFRATYDPQFQLVRTTTDEAGSTTEYLYDLQTMPGPNATGRLERIQYPDATLPDGTIQSGAQTFENDTRGRPIAHITDSGDRSEFHYGIAGPENGRLLRIVSDATGASLTYEFDYDDLGRIIRVTDPDGAVTEQGYTPMGWLSSVTLPAVGGATASLRALHNGDGHVVEIHRPRGSYTDAVIADAHISDAFGLDVLGQARTVSLGVNSAEPRISSQGVDHRGAPTVSVDVTGRRVRHTYDERGNLLEQERTATGLAPFVSQRVYDRSGRLDRTIEPSPGGPVTRFEYDAFGRLSSMNLPNGSTLSRTWGANDRLEREILRGDRGDGVVQDLADTHYEYDERSRLVRTIRRSFSTDPAAGVDVTDTVTHDGDNRVVAVENARGGVTRFAYDGLNRLIETIDADGNIVRAEYNGLDLPVRIERIDIESAGPMSRVWHMEYDPRGRQTRHIAPDGSAVTFEVDDRDIAVREVDPLGVERLRTVGLLGETTRLVRDPAGLNLEQRWQHDAAGRPVAYIDPTGEVSTCAFDGFGRPVQVEAAGVVVSARTFDGAGRMRRERLGNGAELTFDYDAAGRLSRIDGAGAGLVALPTHEYRYDGANRVVQAITGMTVVTRAYDSFSRIISEAMHGGTITSTPDDVAGTVDVRFSDGRTERVTMTANDAVQRIDRTADGALGAGGAQLATFAVTGGTRLESSTLLASITSRATYDARLRLTSVGYDDAAGSVHRTAYGYDAAAQRRFVLHASPANASWHHEYDATSRLVRSTTGFGAPAVSTPVTQADHDAAIALIQAAAALGTRALGYEYDASDSRIQSSESGSAPTAYTYAAGHRMQTAGGEAFTHESGGTRLSDGSRTYEVDALGRIVRVRDGGGAELMALTYDGLGRVAGKTAGGVTRSLRYLDRELREEADGAALVRQYSHHPYAPLPALAHVAGETFALLNDGHFDIVAAVGAAAGTAERYAFGPFGEPFLQAPDGTPRAVSAIGLEPWFGGMPFAPEIGLYLTRSRMYDPVHGVFLSTDPMGYVDSPNLYVFGAQNPIDRIDPDGELFWFVVGIIAVGALASGGMNAARQGIQLAEGSRDDFSWGEMFKSAALGGALAPAVVFAPEVTIPLLTANGVRSAHHEWSEGNRATAGFDLLTAALPWGSKTVRSNVYGKGSIFGQWFRPIDTWKARMAGITDYAYPPGSRAPGVLVAETTFEGMPAWSKSVSTKVPGLKWWAELTIRRQEAALAQLAEQGIPAARVLQPYQRGGALITEHAGESAAAAMKANPALKADYSKHYRDVVKGLGWPRLGRIPLIKQLFHDVKPRNVGYTPEHGFRVFDPAVDPVSLAVGGSVIAPSLYAGTQLEGTAHGQPVPDQPPDAAPTQGGKKPN